jgi:hypothetical protein
MKTTRSGFGPFAQSVEKRVKNSSTSFEQLGVTAELAVTAKVA